MTNNLKNNISKEHLTAYVLDELSQQQNAKIEQAIAKDKALAEELEEITLMCSALKGSFQSQTESATAGEYKLNPVQTNQLVKKMNSDEDRELLRKTSSRKRPVFWGSIVGLAAAVMLAVFVQQYNRGKVSTVANLGKVDQIALVESEVAPQENSPNASANTVKEELLADNNVVPPPKKLPKAKAKPSNKQISGFGAGSGGFSRGVKSSGRSLGGLGVGSRVRSVRSSGGYGQVREQQSQTEDYSFLQENDFQFPTLDPLSTFAADVDTASYSNVRRFLNSGRLPPKDSVRVEEMINYFDYSYKGPTDKRPFAVNVETADAPWNPDHQLVRIGLKAKEIDWQNRPQSNLVFLLDVSGSMSSPNKLPLLKKSFKMMVEQLGENDRVAIVVYAGASGVVLPSTSAENTSTILEAIENLRSGGSTNGGAGIELAYKIAEQNFIKGGINRVLLATDGDFNVGVASRGDLVRLIQQKAKSNVFLSIFGFGMGNYKDSTVEELSGKGNGTSAYIDNVHEAKKVMVKQIGGTMMTIAKDVKLQVEFNPTFVQAYRLVGYENRKMAAQDFHNDKKDGGEIGAGHTVTAMYEVVPVGVKFDHQRLPKLKYQKVLPAPKNKNVDMFTLKVRYKKPESSRSALDEYVILDKKQKFSKASVDFKFASAVAAYGMLLKESKFVGQADLLKVKSWAEQGEGQDVHGYRAEFLKLVDQTIALKTKTKR